MKLTAKLLVFILILSFCSPLLNAQTKNQIYADRQYMTKTVFVIPEGSFEIETGFAYEKERYKTQSVDVVSENITFAQTSFRFGVAKNLEFRADGEFLMNKTTSNGIDSNIQGIRGLAIGSKIKLLDETNAVPDLAVLVNLNIPYGNENLRPDRFEPGLFLALHKSLSPKIRFGMSAGGENKSNLDNYFYSFGTFLDYQITERFNAFVELLGTSTKTMAPEQYAHAGIAFLHQSNLKIDFSLGKLIHGNGSDWFGSLGMSVLLQN
ncbi:MAG: transporter [Bacteroidetes bacterium]|nr:transporter [Bacteroidota bacterium]